MNHIMFIEMFKCLLKHSFKMHLARIAEKKNIPIALRVSVMVCAESDWASIFFIFIFLLFIIFLFLYIPIAF